MSRDHGLVVALQCMSERQKGRPVVSDLRQGVLPLKIVQPYVERHEEAFFIRLMDALLKFEIQAT